MFKRYRFTWLEDGNAGRGVDFYVNSKKSRNGFLHRACVIGSLPRLDEKGNDWAEYRANEEKLFKKRVCKVSYVNRTWESYPGQTCLMRLWEHLCALKFLDMSEISKVNPFGGQHEPTYEDIPEADNLFGNLERRS